jgi:hypothetical protein
VEEMTTKWIRDYTTGESICGVCGEQRNGREECCPTSPYVSFDDFCKEFFNGQAEITWADRSIAREFFDDYRFGNFANVFDYLSSCISGG